MNLSLKLKTALAVLALAPALSWALAGGEGLLDTPHDFASNGPGTAAGGGTGAGNALPASITPVGLCTFCHTPHKAQTSQLLWNHTLSGSTFNWDAGTATTIGGTPFATFTGTYKGPTAKCLSCHDGTVAIGDIAWFAETSHPAGTDTVPTTMPPGEFLITGGGVTPGGNLSGNHPVAMPFPANNAPSTYNGVTTGLQVNLPDFVANPVASNVPGTSAIRLFTDPGGSAAIAAGVTPGSTGIECSSCHDPHNKASVDDLFLRGKLIGSTQADGYICLQCHIK
jgi:hypothetical protein